MKDTTLGSSGNNASNDDHGPVAAAPTNNANVVSPAISNAAAAAASHAVAEQAIMEPALLRNLIVTALRRIGIERSYCDIDHIPLRGKAPSAPVSTFNNEWDQLNAMFEELIINTTEKESIKPLVDLHDCLVLETRAAKEGLLLTLPGGFKCALCNIYNKLYDSRNTWYSVTRSLCVGVFKGLHNVLPLVNGVSTASFMKGPTKEHATSL